MKRLLAVLFVSAAALTGVFALVSSAWGQTESPELLRPILTIGRQRPTGIDYDPNLDRFVWTNDQGQLQIVDARNYRPLVTLYEDFDFGRHYTLSHDGRYIAVANGRVVDLFETSTGVLAASIEPNGSRGLQSPLIFSQDDTYLLMSVVVPERQELRRSENDTTIVPYLWDLPNALDIDNSRLPGRVDVLPFFDNRNGFVLAPDNLIIAALPRRLQLFDLDGDLFTPTGEIQTGRFEQDPIDVWFSQFDDIVYHRPLDSRELIQIDTQTAVVTRIPLGASLDAVAMRSLNTIRFGSVSQIVGAANDRVGSSLVRALLGDNYARSYDDHAITFTLVDVLDPVTVPPEQNGLLVYILDETTGRGTFDLIQPLGVRAYTINPDRTQIALLEAGDANNGAVKIYDLASGALVRTIQPAARSSATARPIFTYNAAGDQLLVDFQRFDMMTGDVIAQDLNYGDTFESYRFAADSASLITERSLGSRYEWWEWGIPSGDVIRRENFTIESLSSLRSDPARGRTLYSINRGELQGVEIVDLLAGTRDSLLFDLFPGRVPDAVYPSDDWRHFLAVYSVSPYSPHYPGNEIVIYRFGEGAVWHYAGADLPYVDSREYGWVDDTTAYVSGINFDSGSAPERIYGLTFDATGVPQCLVEAFPDEWQRWINLWERLTLTLRGVDLMALARTLCQALPAPLEVIEGVFFPTATPTRPFYTPTPAVIAGVPACLTQRFAREAVGYAQSWRELIDGLTPEQIAELETLLCEGLSGAGAPPSDQGGEAPPQQVYLIDIGTGDRTQGAYVPRRAETGEGVNISLIADAYRQQTGGFNLNDFMLSPDQRLIAARNGDGTITIYQLLTPYTDLAAFATQTAEPGRTFDPRAISVQATPTQAFVGIGGAQPTLTPTITPTSPPPAAQIYALPERGQITDFCPLTRYTTDDAPESYAPGGELLVTLINEESVFALDPRTGDLRLDETIPRCINCQYSPDRSWLLNFDDGITVSRPDGSVLTQLFTPRESPLIFGTTWFDGHTVEYRYEGFLPDRGGSRTLVQYYDADTGEYSEPFEPAYGVQINELGAEIVSEQPRGREVVVARQSFNGGTGNGYKYYIVDYARGETIYFARLVEPDNTSIRVIWHPSGDLFYYQVGNDVNWYIYHTATGERSIFGLLPIGVQAGNWSLTERYTSVLSNGVFEGLSRDDNYRPALEIYDHETGRTNRYCFAPSDSLIRVLRSWDDRLIALSIITDEERQLETARPRLYILDLATGDLVEVLNPRVLDIDSILTWTQ